MTDRKRAPEFTNPLCAPGKYCPECGTRLSDNGSRAEFATVRECPVCPSDGEVVA